ncbi:hypothetical protein D2E95_09390 [Mycobacteroides abscessus]|uniref:hypothetical protein n=1 Tax=Mycobacteroides abscessus TaxID=36809 RepID=UPI000E697AEC|nr:hypothetical protein [Mycobacteroides abscessus]RIT59393.1 hypothetical protein D2E95_09390 [Mycobacteroides abscessus]RIU52496.1 hypothetical protein D2F02_05635 [Mycobacteroides abscessus]
MNGPTKSAILGADLNSYHGKLDTYKPFAAHYESVISKLKGSIYKPSGTYWDGATAEAGQHNTESGWKFTAKVHDIIDTYNSAAAPIIDNTIVPELTNAQHIIENVESQRDKGITCSEDLKLTYTPLPGTSEKVIEENTKLVQARQAELTKSANAWLAGCQQVAQLVTTAQQDITGVLNSAAGTFDINKALAATAPRATPNSTVKPDNYLAALQGQAGEGAGDTKPTAAPIGDTIDYKKVYPKDVSVGDKSVDPSKLGGVGAIPGVRDSATGREPPAKLAPALQAKDVPAFKEMTREVLTRQGVPADQIEAQVNKAVENAQNPRLVRTDVPSASPSEHVSRDFGEQWNKFFANASDGGSKAGDAILDEGKKLTGLAGPGAPGVAEAWGALAKDTAKGLYDYATMTPQERLEMLGNEAQRAADNPGGYLGEKLVQGAAGPPQARSAAKPPLDYAASSETSPTHPTPRYQAAQDMRAGTCQDTIHRLAVITPLAQSPPSTLSGHFAAPTTSCTKPATPTAPSATKWIGIEANRTSKTSPPTTGCLLTNCPAHRSTTFITRRIPTSLAPNTAPKSTVTLSCGSTASTPKASNRFSTTWKLTARPPRDFETSCDRD